MAPHSNARTCPNCRAVMIHMVLDQRRPISEVAAAFGVSRETLHKWLRRYRTGGPKALVDRSCRPDRIHRKYPPPTDELKNVLFKTLHAPPRDHGFNRTTWRIGDLVTTLSGLGYRVNERTVSQLIREGGYRWKKAKVVLTSNDPKFREKLDRVRGTLAQLEEDEAFFSVDEFGPFAVRMRGGRALIPPGEFRAVPQWQKSKGALIVTSALELSLNQVTHFYSKRKNTEQMILLLRRLASKYADRRRIYVTWDAAPWHRSRGLFDFIRAHNEEAARRTKPEIWIVPLPARAQFLNVIESVFSGMARAIIHNSDYASPEAAREAIDLYFAERNDHFRRHPRRAGNRIWGKERVPSAFAEHNNCKDPEY